MDDEGFMVTKKQMESCSESDDDQDEQEKAEKPKSPEKDVKEEPAKMCDKKAPSIKAKNATGPANKQASIMSFFQKK